MNQEINKSAQVNKYVILGVSMAAAFFNPFMGAAVNIALPDISNDFSMGAVSMSWIAMSYLLASAIFLVPFGKIADIWGRKKVFLAGNIFFATATILCAVSVNSTMLIISRFLQGIGGALMFSTSMAILISAFPPQERGKVIGYNVSAVYIGLSAAPLLGGLLTHTLGWRSLFFINALAEIPIILAILFKIKAEWAEAKGEKFDYSGSGVYMFSVFLMMYGFSKLPDIYAIIFTLIGLAGLLIFIKIELNAQFPVLNMRLFKENRVFAFSNLAALINYAATFGVTFIMSLYLQKIKLLSPLDAGTIMIIQPVFMAIFASFSGRLSDKYDSGILASTGMGIIVLGLIILSFMKTNTPYWILIVALAILGIGFGLFSSPNTNSVMSSVEKRFLGVASATVSTMRLTGQMISMAIASMSIHVFLGDAKIDNTNIDSFLHASKVVLLIFVVLCVLGVFASLARGTKKVS